MPSLEEKRALLKQKLAQRQQAVTPEVMPTDSPMPAAKPVMSLEEKRALLKQKLATRQGEAPQLTRGERNFEQLKEWAGKAGQATLSGLQKFGEFTDKYTGAPTRAAIKEIYADDPEKTPISAFVDQFGEDPGKAPTGKEISEDLGIPKGTASSVAGFAVDVLADPTNVIPVGTIAKTAVRGIGKGAKVLGKAGKLTKKGTGAAVRKVAETTTGIPARDIKFYSENLDDVNNIITKYGDDFASAADDVKAKYNTSIQNFRKTTSNQITEALAKSDAGVKADLNPIVTELKKASDALEPAFKADADQIAELDDIIKQIDDFTGGTGEANVAQLFKIKEELQDFGKSAYMKQGQLFARGDKTSRASKAAAREARLMLNKLSPEIAQANNKLARLHSIEDVMNKNILKEGKASASLIAAGRGTSRDAKMLKQIGELTQDPSFVREAEKLAAMKSFAKPELIPTDITGKSATRAAAALGIGLGTGGVSQVGFALAGALASPMALKAAINAGQVPKKLISNALGMSAKVSDLTVKKAYDVLTGPQGANIMRETMRGARLYSIDRDRRNPSEFVDISEEEKPIYVQSVMDDENLNVLEKARRRDLVNKKGKGIIDKEEEVEGLPPQLLQPEANGTPLDKTAEKLRTTR